MTSKLTTTQRGELDYLIQTLAWAIERSPSYKESHPQYEVWARIELVKEDLERFLKGKSIFADDPKEEDSEGYTAMDAMNRVDDQS